LRIRVGIGAEGEIVLPPREADALGLPGGGDGELVSARGAFAILTAARGDQPRAWFAGSLAALTVPEVVQFVFTTLKTGVLLLALRPAQGDGPAAAADEAPERLRRRSIYFRDGQVVFASSSEPADRLGPVLLRAGLVDAPALERCSRLVRGGRPLGQVLVDEGVLSSGQLYEGLTLQVKEILLNAFVETAGTFAFLEGPVDEQNVVRLPGRTRDLLLEGMRRVEEAEALARELGGRGAVLSRAAAPALGLSPAEARLLDAVDGRRSIPELAVEAGLGLLEALRAAAALTQGGAVVAGVPPQAEQLESAPPEAAAAALQAGPFETYRRILRRVHEALAAALPDARARLNSYFDRLPPRIQPVFEGVRVREDGDIDVARVLGNVAATGEYRGAAARARSLEALEDLLAFALFEAKNCLPRAEAEALLREVGRMQMGKA
jgi:hypothetical protein